jgi:hypothetical protein
MQLVARKYIIITHKHSPFTADKGHVSGKIIIIIIIIIISSSMLGIIIIFVYLYCAVSVIGLVAVDSAHK